MWPERFQRARRNVPVVECARPVESVRGAAVPVHRPVARTPRRRARRADRAERRGQIHPPKNSRRDRGAGRRHALVAPRRAHRVSAPGRNLHARSDRPRGAARSTRRPQPGGTRTGDAGRHHAHAGRVRRPRQAGVRVLRRVAEAAGGRPRVGPRAGPAAPRRADQPPRPAGRRLARTPAAGRAVRLPRRYPRPRVPPRGRGRDHRGEPRVPRRDVPRRRRVRRLRREARGVPGSPGPAARRGRQPGAPRDRVARPQGRGPHPQSEFPHRGRRAAARGTGRAELPHRGSGHGRHRLLRHRPPDAETADRHRAGEVARRAARCSPTWTCSSVRG